MRFCWDCIYDIKGESPCLTCGDDKSEWVPKFEEILEREQREERI